MRPAPAGWDGDTERVPGTIRLEDLKPNAAVRGILPDCLVRRRGVRRAATNASGDDVRSQERGERAYSTREAVTAYQGPSNAEMRLLSERQ